MRNKYSALLKGIVRCATCDAGVIHTYTEKKNHLYRYYVCVKAHQRGWDKCQTRSVSAQALETAVVEQIRGISRNPAMMGEVLRQLADQSRRSSVDSDREKAVIERELEKLAQEMGGLAGMVSSPSPAARSATDRLAAPHERAAELEQRLAGVREKTGKADSQQVDSNDLQQKLEEFDPLWEQMTPLEREKFIGALVKQVSYDGTTGTVTVEFRSGGIRSLCENGTARHS